jgi:hypothetical protein
VLSTRKHTIRDVRVPLEMCITPLPPVKLDEACGSKFVYGWYCYLPKGHIGFHHAHSPTICRAVWEEVPAEPIYKNRVIQLRREMEALQ